VNRNLTHIFAQKAKARIAPGLDELLKVIAASELDTREELDDASTI